MLATPEASEDVPAPVCCDVVYCCQTVPNVGSRKTEHFTTSKNVRLVTNVSIFKRANSDLVTCVCI